MLRALHVAEDLARVQHLLRRVLSLPVRDPSATIQDPAASVEVESMLARRDEEIDLAHAAALIAREDDRSVDLDRVLAEVDYLAVTLKGRLRGAGPDVEARIARANAFFFDEAGFRATDDGVLGHAGRLLGLQLPYVLRRRAGRCLGLSLAYVAVASRAGLPLHAVSVPGHIFCRWDDGHERVNVETTRRGAAFSDGYYVERYGLDRDHVERGVYLQNLCRRELLVEVLNNRANCLYDRGDVQRASRDLDRVVRLSPGFARGFASRGFLALDQGELGAAVRELTRAVEIDPLYARAHLHLGDALLRLGSVEKGLATLLRAVALDPSSALARTNLGRAYARLGDAERAIAEHERALDLDPECHVAWHNLGVARRVAGDVDGARAAFREALDLAPHFLEARESLALIERARGHGIRAALAVRSTIRAYRRRLRATPGDAALHASLARFLVEAGGAVGEAARAAETACRLAPASALAWEVASLVAREAGDTARAAKLAERARSLSPAS